MKWTILFVVTLLQFSCTGNQKSDKRLSRQNNDTFPRISLELVDWHPQPVLKTGDPGTEDIKHGIEGGSVIKQNNEYHLLLPSSEVVYNYVSDEWYPPWDRNIDLLCGINFKGGDNRDYRKRCQAGKDCCPTAKRRPQYLRGYTGADGNAG